MANDLNNSLSGIRDNYRRGSVGDFLKEKIKSGSALSIVSAYFTIYAYEALKEQLESIESMRFLFGEPRFVKSLDPEKTDKKSFRIEDAGLKLDNQLNQKRVARECADWLKRKVEIGSIKRPAFCMASCITSLMAALKTPLWAAPISRCKVWGWARTGAITSN